MCLCSCFLKVGGEVMGERVRALWLTERSMVGLSPSRFSCGVPRRRRSAAVNAYGDRLPVAARPSFAPLPAFARPGAANQPHPATNRGDKNE